MNMFKTIWKAIDGKKLVTGVIVTGLGMVGQALDIPGSEVITIAGMGTLGIGGGHKVVKKRRKNNV